MELFGFLDWRLSKALLLAPSRELPVDSHCDQSCLLLDTWLDVLGNQLIVYRVDNSAALGALAKAILPVATCYLLVTTGFDVHIYELSTMSTT